MLTLVPEPKAWHKNGLVLTWLQHFLNTSYLKLIMLTFGKGMMPLALFSLLPLESVY
jgi:hypothetical protein